MKDTTVSHVFERSFRFLSIWPGAVSVFLLMTVVAVNIITRVLGRSIPGILDISQSFMVIIVTMMLAHTQARRGHIGVEFVVNHLPGSIRKVVELITLSLSLAFSFLLIWQSWVMACSSALTRDHSAVYPYLPIYPVKLILAVGVSLLGIQLVMDIVKILRKRT